MVVRTLQRWFFCTLMVMLVAWPGAVPALALCVGHDHDPHVVQLGTPHDESVPHEHAHGEHGDAGVEAGCCADECCVDVPINFLLDSCPGGSWSQSARVATLDAGVALGLNLARTAIGEVARDGVGLAQGCLTVRMNC